MLSYQWFGPRGVLTDMSGKIEGSDDVLLMIRNVSMADVGNYQVVVTNQFGATVTSNMASLQICKLCVYLIWGKHYKDLLCVCRLP